MNEKKKEELKLLFRELVVALEKATSGNDLLTQQLADMLPDITREYIKLKNS